MYETIDKYRVFPRFILLASGWFCWEVSSWFTAIPDPSGPQSAYASSVVLACIGIMKYYVENGFKK